MSEVQHCGGQRILVFEIISFLDCVIQTDGENGIVWIWEAELHQEKIVGQLRGARRRFGKKPGDQIFAQCISGGVEGTALLFNGVPQLR